MGILDRTKKEQTMLTSNKHSERASAHEARKQQIDRDLADANRQIQRIREESTAKHVRDHAEAEAALERARAPVAAALVADWQRATDPLFAAWVREPSRRLGGQIAEQARTFRDRSREELGCDIWQGVIMTGLVHAMAAEHPGVITPIATEFGSGSLPVSGAEACWRAVDSTVGFFDALERFECDLADLSRRAIPETEHARARFAVMRRISSMDDRAKLLGAFDAAPEAKRLAVLAFAYP